MKPVRFAKLQSPSSTLTSSKTMVSHRCCWIVCSLLEERRIRREKYEAKMDQLKLSQYEREKRMKKLYQIETQYIRSLRVRLSTNTFTPIKTIGKGSFGEVFIY